MSYQTIVERKARKAIARLPSTVYNLITDAIEGLTEDPLPHNSLKLRGRGLRVGGYRVIYRVDDEAGEVRVLEVWHRQEITPDPAARRP